MQSFGPMHLAACLRLLLARHRALPVTLMPVRGLASRRTRATPCRYQLQPRKRAMQAVLALALALLACTLTLA